MGKASRKARVMSSIKRAIKKERLVGAPVIPLEKSAISRMVDVDEDIPTKPAATSDSDAATTTATLDPRGRHRKETQEVMAMLKKMRAQKDNLGHSLQEREERKRIVKEIADIEKAHREKCAKEVAAWKRSLAVPLRDAVNDAAKAKKISRKRGKLSRAGMRHGMATAH